MLYTGGTPGPFRAIYATATVTKKEGTAMKTVPTPTSLVFAGWLSILKKRLVPTLRDAALLPDYSKVVERDL
ncbi:uncharacterized protein N7469_001292 [Penicillium citrinum]|uniref:Uncharacterized protein n=1 Tax=Penicillium citrinum TaxID=5077 RepID=A0A9W9TXG2_PENCI|nr:uncharacterized protein N7469_001292 [Penicillium citrinum]KAJ5242965.1 hypothetical protein N7469_001292 [Penicillium citrinum]